MTFVEATSGSDDNHKVLPRDFGSEEVARYLEERGLINDCSFKDDSNPEASYYVFKGRSFFPVSRSVVLLLLVEPYDKFYQMEGSTVGLLFYMIYFPVGLLITTAALLAFCIWFDCCIQPWMLEPDQIGIYGNGRHFAWKKKSDEDVNNGGEEPNEAVDGKRQRQTPISTCLCIYNACLVTKQVEYDEEEVATRVGAEPLVHA
ncbi:expressed unknown protein [Seminavis robusta]|uniref:Uncharacterized protein n=1 Tax=Seminavis robusta TaxID=568900 RepID=A0A9N8EKH1_9STRA|nr:expressed unknown protein [Seminavis robusta]|eukprot:Sro1076_g238510.1 n/a (203) ;mRNA; f:13967-14575